MSSASPSPSAGDKSPAPSAGDMGPPAFGSNDVTPSPNRSMQAPTYRKIGSTSALHALSSAATASMPSKVAKETPNAKENFRTLSCSECKRRKIKCDRNTPCGPCILRNDQARCKPVIRWEAGCSLSEFTILQNRVTELESRLDGMQAVIGRPTNEVANSIATLAAVTSKQEPLDAPTPNGTTSSGQPSAPRNGGNNGREDDAVMMLEDFAMGNRANARRAAQKLVPRPGLPTSNSSASLRPGDSPDLLRMETAVNQRSADPAIDVAYRFLRLAPSAEVQRDIVEYWFERLEWYTKCLYRPNYMEDFALLASLDAETAARTVRPSFLCVHFMVICLSVHLCSGEEVENWGFQRQSALNLCDALFAGSQQLLWASDFIGSHQLEHLQAVVLMSVYAYNVDEQADAAYALVGASIKIAQNLALNRLDDVRFLEKERQKGKSVNVLISGGSSSQSSLQTTSPLEREIGKRVWWYLIWLDWSHALSHGGCYSIHPAHNRTSMPANVSDKDLAACMDNTGTANALIAKPLDEYTEMSYTIWRLRFLNVYRETIDILNTPTGMTQPLLAEMDKKLMDLLNGLPSYFQLRISDHDSWTFGDSCHDMELLSIQITGWNRLLRLHRPFLARALYERSSTNVSRKRCVEAAFNMLALFRHARHHAPLLLKVWIHIYYAFSGALVLFLDLCYDEGSDSKEDKRNAIRELLAICDTARHLSAAAKNTYNLLQGLLEAETELRAPQNGKESTKDAGAAAAAAAAAGGNASSNGGKRKRGKTGSNTTPTAFSPFVSLVERVLVDAANKTGSGDSAASSSMGRSPSEYGSALSMIDPPAKRHTTSYVRDRQHSTSSNTGSGRRYGGRHDSISASTSAFAAGGQGAGHGNYYADNEMNAAHSSSFHNSFQGNSTSSQQQPPLSPWNRTSTGIAGNNGPSTPWGSNLGGGGGFPSPSSAFNGQSLGSPSTMYGHANGGVDGSGRSAAAGPFAGAFGTSTAQRGGGAAATTSGLSSLLDEDIFSGLLMNQHMENNSDWESALAFVAPLPTPTQGTGVGGTSGAGNARPSTAGSHHHLQHQQSPTF